MDKKQNHIAIFQDGGLWETDFISKDLLEGYISIFLTPDKFKDLNYWKDSKDIIVDNVKILVFSSNVISYQEILNIVIYVKPLVIFHLSDEWGWKKEYNELSKYSKLLIRQHHHGSYNNIYNNIIYMPLGYMKNMIGTSLSEVPKPKLITERKYAWSFIGNMKSDRQYMIDLFKSSNIGDYYNNNNIPAKDMYEIYKDSIFIPNGRGNIRLDCFRLYEASLSGAIPVVVGDKNETHETFLYEDNPPWIFASSWEDAIIICKNLINNTDELIKKQLDILNWWNKRIANIKLEIDNIVL